LNTNLDLNKIPSFKIPLWRRGKLLILLFVLAGFLAGFLQDLTFGSGYSGGIRLPGLIGISLLGLGFVLLLARNRGKIKLKKFFSTRLGICFLGFIILNFLTCLGGMFQYGVLDTLTDADWLVWAGVMLLVLAEDSQIVAQRLLIIFWVLSVVRALQGVANLLQGRAALFLTTGGDRYVGGSVAQFIAAGLIISSVWFLLGAKRRSQKRILVFVAILQLFAILISFNRQTWVALSFALVVGFALFFRGKLLRIIIIGITLLSVLLISVFIADQWSLFPVSIGDILLKRLGVGTNLDKYIADSAIQFRFAAWRVAFQVIIESPVFGKGWGSPLIFRTAHATYNMSPHNTYLWLAYKSGLPSLILYLLFVWTLIITGVKRYKTAQTRSQKALLSITILIEILYSVGALWWDYLTAMYVSIPIWLNRGLLTFYCFQNTNQQIEEQV